MAIIHECLEEQGWKHIPERLIADAESYNASSHRIYGYSSQKAALDIAKINSDAGVMHGDVLLMV